MNNTAMTIVGQLRQGEVPMEDWTADGLVELASATAPDDAAIQRVRADVYAGGAAAETSLIGKAIFSVYRRDAVARS